MGSAPRMRSGGTGWPPSRTRCATRPSRWVGSSSATMCSATVKPWRWACSIRASLEGGRTPFRWQTVCVLKARPRGVSRPRRERPPERSCALVMLQVRALVQIGVHEFERWPQGCLRPPKHGRAWTCPPHWGQRADETRAAGALPCGALACAQPACDWFSAHHRARTRWASKPLVCAASKRAVSASTEAGAVACACGAASYCSMAARASCALRPVCSTIWPQRGPVFDLAGYRAARALRGLAGLFDEGAGQFDGCKRGGCHGFLLIGAFCANQLNFCSASPR